jgi:hypothetical protein
MSDWKTDRDKLREEIREHGKKGGMKATFLYVLLSHMRGKIHMQYYNKYHGGWRWSKKESEAEIPREFRSAYGDSAKTYYLNSVIEDLADQEEWIRKHIEFYKQNEEMFSLAERVIGAYNEKDARVA